jgi:excisionase family DNA binding protein
MSIASCGFSRLETSGRALFSPRETEEILGVSHATVYRLIAGNKLDARKLGTKTLITAESIYRLIAELPLAQVRGTD